MNIQKQLIRPNQFTRPGIPLRRVSAIAIHYTGDPGATAQNERNYFDGSCISAGRFASCHFVIGLNGEIIQLIPTTEWAYCTCQANSYSISIETCHPDSTGKFTEASEKALIEFSSYLCKQYGLNPSNGLIRHYDVTGKICPKYYVDHSDLWQRFKQAVSNCMNGKPYSLPSYGKIIGFSVAESDTTGNFSVKQGGIYQFKITSDTQPSLICGSSCFKPISVSQSGRNYFFKFQAIGKKGDGAGFYLNGSKSSIAVAKII